MTRQLPKWPETVQTPPKGSEHFSEMARKTVPDGAETFQNPGKKNKRKRENARDTVHERRQNAPKRPKVSQTLDRTPQTSATWACKSFETPKESQKACAKCPNIPIKRGLPNKTWTKAPKKSPQTASINGKMGQKPRGPSSSKTFQTPAQKLSTQRLLLRGPGRRALDPPP